MTITDKKAVEEILAALEGYEKIFIVGCGDCATVCETGGEHEVEEMKKALEAAGKTVVGTAIPESTCEVLVTKKELRQHKDAVEAADAFLVLSCGAGTQAVTSIVEKPVIPGLDTLFLGDTVRKGQFYEWCSACAECVLADYAGICPVTRCPKGQLHGPCGGAQDGKCEVDPEQDCVWSLIYERARKIGQWDAIAQRMVALRHHKRATKPRKRVFEPRRAGLSAARDVE